MPAPLPLPHPVDRLLALTGPRPRIAVAFSGGLDSTVLAHSLVKSRRRLAHLRLLHVDHGLQFASAGWAKHCARLARRWQVPLTVLRASIERTRGESPEAAARDARYALLAGALDAGEVLVTAQHRDDQVETLLLQLFRGAGVAGLAAMPAIARFEPGRIARPLLDEARADLERYAQRHALEWIEDPTNAETKFARNFLRNEVLPQVRARWPGLDGAIARSAAHMAEARELLDSVTRTDLNRLADGAGLSAAGVRALPNARRRAAVRALVVRAGIAAPPAAKLSEIVGALLTARPDAQPEQRIAGAVVRRRSGRLEVEVKSHEPEAEPGENFNKSWDWSRDRECFVNAAGDQLSLIEDSRGAIDLDRLPARLTLAPRRGGEKLRLGPRARTQSLKKLLQGARVSVDERARLPLLFVDDRLVAAGDRWIDASIAANVKSRRRARLRWCRAGNPAKVPAIRESHKKI